MLTNAGLYCDWFRSHQEKDLFDTDPRAARLLKPDPQSGLLYVKDIACLLPFLRVYWRWPAEVSRMFGRLSKSPADVCPSVQRNWMAALAQ